MKIEATSPLVPRHRRTRPPLAALFWSTGKDSAFALHRLRHQGWNVPWLVTTVHEENGRVAVHGVRNELLEAQAQAVALELVAVPLPNNVSNEVYCERVSEALIRLKGKGCTHVASGDLFLEDVRQFRAKLIEDAQLEPLFPLWTDPASTQALAIEMLSTGLQARIVAVDPQKVSPDWLGREWNAAFLRALPFRVDPLGERGEFHTFAVWGPGFRKRIEVVPGALQDGVSGQRWRDLIPEPALLAGSRPGRGGDAEVVATEELATDWHGSSIEAESARGNVGSSPSQSQENTPVS